MWISIMYILTIKGKESKGAYSVVDKDNEQVLYMFEEKDDATRYALQLEDRNYPKMRVMEIEDEMMIRSCELHGHKYACLLYTSPSPRDTILSRMPSSA